MPERRRSGTAKINTLTNAIADVAPVEERLTPPEHDPEKWVPVFPRDKREAFARRSCSNKKMKRDDDSKKSHRALVAVAQNHVGAGAAGLHHAGIAAETGIGGRQIKP